MNELIYSTINDIYLNKCKNEREKIGFVEDIYAIGDLHGDFDVLIKILIKYNLIVKTKKYNYKNFNFEYKLKDNLKSLCIIQLGDQLDGNRHLDYTKNNFKDEDDKIVYFFDNLKEQSKKLKEVYIISIIGNHEFMNLIKIYKYVSPNNLNIRDQFIDDNKLNILCNRYYCFVVNGFVFSHCGIIKSLILNLDLMYPKLNLINNLNQLDNINDKIDYLDKLIRILMINNIYKNEKDDKDDKINEDKLRELLYKFFGARKFFGGKIEDLNINCSELNSINEIIHIDNMVIGHTMQYHGIKNYKCSNYKSNKNIFVIDTGLSGSFQVNTLKQTLHVHFNNIDNINDYNIYYNNV